MYRAKTEHETAMQLIESLNSALTRIGQHVGAVCCGVDVDELDDGHTATAIIERIEWIVNNER